MTAGGNTGEVVQEQSTTVNRSDVGIAHTNWSEQYGQCHIGWVARARSIIDHRSMLIMITMGRSTRKTKVGQDNQNMSHTIPKV